jgi:1-acyl-sn-glycerol-3-phosphate acyltransferase
VIDLGARVPRAPRPLLRWCALRLLGMLGWRLDIRIPDEPRFIIIGAPHTSNWDGVIGVLAMLAMELRLALYVKHTAFESRIVGGILRRLDAFPVDRSAPGGVVAQTIAAFRERAQLAIAIAPEGTRRRVAKWKRGFYLIAQEAGVPIVLAYLDYARKVVGTGPVLRPGGDYARDLETIQAFYRTVAPRRPENFNASG